MVIFHSFLYVYQRVTSELRRVAFPDLTLQLGVLAMIMKIPSTDSSGPGLSSLALSIIIYIYMGMGQNLVPLLFTSK